MIDCSSFSNSSVKVSCRCWAVEDCRAIAIDRSRLPYRSTHTNVCTDAFKRVVETRLNKAAACVKYGGT